MKISIDELRKILKYAEKHDLDDEITIDYNHFFNSITVYLNEHGWKMFERIRQRKKQRVGERKCLKE